MESKDLVALCRQNGIDVKSQLSTIEPEVRDQVVQLVQKKSGSPSVPPRAVPPTLPATERKVPVLDTKPRPAPELGRTPSKPTTSVEPGGKAAAPAPTAPPETSAPSAPATPVPRHRVRRLLRRKKRPQLLRSVNPRNLLHLLKPSMLLPLAPRARPRPKRPRG
jgi:hypothetical protein